MNQDLCISYEAEMSETIKGRRRYVDTFFPCHKFSTVRHVSSFSTDPDLTLQWKISLYTGNTLVLL